mmetsp:Transcript_382/g.757  ORF Transcript_382/g.757 Transcript_382/m.757 type:complete len:233 (+) Transcript_382:5097-5795(+)
MCGAVITFFLLPVFPRRAFSRRMAIDSQVCCCASGIEKGFARNGPSSAMRVSNSDFCTFLSSSKASSSSSINSDTSLRRNFSFSEGGSRSGSLMCGPAPLVGVSPPLPKLFLASPPDSDIFVRRFSSSISPESNMTSSIIPSLMRARPHASIGVFPTADVTGFPLSSLNSTFPVESMSGSVPGKTSSMSGSGYGAEASNEPSSYRIEMVVFSLFVGLCFPSTKFSTLTMVPM